MQVRIQITVQVMRTLFLKFISNYQNAHYLTSERQHLKLLDTPKKWSTWAFKTNTLPLWCDLMLKPPRTTTNHYEPPQTTTNHESYSPLYLSDEEISTVIRSILKPSSQPITLYVWLKMSCMFMD